MKRTHLDLGARGEETVVAHLQERGDEILDRNWRVREGEIDIVSRDAHAVIHIIEVKTRTSLAFGHPLEAIDTAKAHRLQRLALAWLATHGAFGHPFQIDVAAVIISADQRTSLEIREAVL